jgi:hypothetical protein
MPRSLPFFALTLVCAGIAVGCGKKDVPEPGGGDPTSGEDKRAAVERLERVAKAVSETANAFTTFPTGFVGPGGRLGLSWRVAILPYLGEDALYREFKTAEPWDSEHNKKLLARMPKALETGAPAGQTHIRSFAGSRAIIPAGPPGGRWGVNPWQNQRAGVFANGRPYLGLADGAAYTLFAAEAAEPVEWTKPDELDFADQPDGPPQPLPKLGGRFAGGFHGLMCDGRVFFFPDTLGEAEIRKLITADAGDAPGPELAAMLAPSKPAPKVGPPDEGGYTDVTDGKGKVIGKKKTYK